MVGQGHTAIPRLGILRLPRRRSLGSPFELTGEVSALIRAVGIAIGMSVSLSSASAEIEEVSGQDGPVSDYSRSPLLPDLSINFSENGYVSIPVKSGQGYLAHGTVYSGTGNKQYGTDTISIPEVVWSLDVSTGVHLDHVSGELKSQLDTMLGGRTTEPWVRGIPDFWAEKNPDRSSNHPLLSPVQFQVASCGGNSAEGRDLDYCSVDHTLTSKLTDGTKSAGTNTDNGTIIASNSSNNTVSLNITSTSIQENQSDANRDLSPLMLARVNDFIPQGDLTDLSALSPLCNDVSASCALAADNINPPMAPIDPSTTPIDSPTQTDLLPPNQVIVVDDPGTVLDQLSNPPLAASTIPETSTWIMTMIGFGFMLFACRGKALPPIKQVLAGTLFKITKKSFRYYTA